jgi:site-specific recombinase XerD
MLEQTSPLRHYAAGVRVSELISLTVKKAKGAKTAKTAKTAT